MSESGTVLTKTPSFEASHTINSIDSGSLSRTFLEHQGYVSDKWEHYLSIYEAALARFRARGQPIRLLEIGVQNGGSLQIWSKYLPQGSRIVGIDIDPACVGLPMGANISILIGDAKDPVALNNMLGDARFDVIIDDGSHHSNDVISTFEACFERLSPGGLYVIEDLHCSYLASHDGGFRRAGSSIEWLKGLVDALNADHFEDDAAVTLGSAGLQSLHKYACWIAQTSFFDSVVIVEKLVNEKQHPYSRIMTGREGRVVDLANEIPLMTTARLRTLLLSPSAAASFAPALLNAIASAREEVGQLREELAQAEVRHEGEMGAASERAEQHAVESEIRLAEEVRQRIDAGQRAEQAERRLGVEMRLRVQAEQRAAEAEIRFAEEARRRTDAEQRAVAMESERNRFRNERDALLGSTFWRLTGPPRRIASFLPPGLRQYGRRGARVVYWLLTPHRTGERIAYFRTRQGRALVLPAPDVEPDDAAAQEPVAADHLEPQPEKLPTYDQLFRQRFSALEPLRTYEAPHHGPRVTIVTESINAGSLYGGVGTAIILGALLAQRLGGNLRLVTRGEPPVATNVATVLQTSGISWSGNMEFLYSPIISGGHDVPFSRDDLFLTTNWWTIPATRRAVPAKQIIALVQEDERMFYPLGDDHLICAETLSDPSLLYVVNSNLLLCHLQSEGMTPGGIAFEPAFPNVTYYIERRPEHNTKWNFFFYARPNNLRNLYWRGVAAIATALEEGVFDPEKWDFFFVGKDAPELVLPRGVRPRVMHDLPWPEYGALVRRIDVGLSLMYTPHPSYPPLDLAASGAVVVTNRFGSKLDLSRFSPNILCVDPSVSGLVAGLRQAVALAADRATRAANTRQFGMPRDWAETLVPVLDQIVACRPRG